MKATVHKITHLIKSYLARRYDLKHLKVLAFVIALMSCLSLGSILLFSLFSRALHYSVGLTYTEINFIVSLSAAGMYFCLPVLGYLADAHGPALLTVISIWTFCPAYYINARLVKNVSENMESQLQWGSGTIFVMAISFCFIGIATSSLYFASLITCAKIYPHKKSLAISLPVSCYGLSSLIGSQIMKLPYFHQLDDTLHLYKVFLFFSVLYLVVGILNLVSNSIVTIEQDVVFGETEPLLALSDEEDQEACLTPQRSTIEPSNHKERYVKFLKDSSAWVLLLSFLFAIGPMESFQNNLGLIIESVAGDSVKLTGQVSILAALSTAIRLFIGIIADWISSENRTYPICKAWLLIILAGVGVVAQILPLFSVNFNAISLLNGVCYGGLFTTYPTVIASIWGVDLMGSTWGSFMVAPAVGSIAFSLLHGHQMDVCRAESGGHCLDAYFKATTTCLAISILLIVFVWRVMWLRKGLKCF